MEQGADFCGQSIAQSRLCDPLIGLKDRWPDTPAIGFNSAGEQGNSARIDRCAQTMGKRGLKMPQQAKTGHVGPKAHGLG